MFAIEIIWILVLLTCVSSHSLHRQEEEIDIEVVEADSFETSFGDSVYECSRKSQGLRQNNTKFLIPLGKSKVGLLDGTSVSFKADALLQPNGSLTIHTTMTGVMKEAVRQMSGRAPPSTFNPGFKPDRPSFGVMLTEAVADFSFRMMINSIHGMIRMTNQGKETEIMSKMIMVRFTFRSSSFKLLTFFSFSVKWNQFNALWTSVGILFIWSCVSMN